MTALTTVAALALAAQWGQPVAAKLIVAEATVESGLDPVGFPIRTTNRATPLSTKDSQALYLRDFFAKMSRLV